MLENLFSDLFDLYPTENFNITNFIKDGQLHLEQIWSHPYIQRNITFSYVWNFVYKTYPTKKDFSEFKGSVYNLEELVNSFFHVRLGMTIDSNALLKGYTALKNQVYDATFVKSFVIKKLEYRYNQRFDLDLSFTDAYQKLSILDFDVTNCNPFSNNINNNITFTENDNKYMRSLEKLQYVVYKDNQFMSKLINGVCILIDNQNFPYIETLKKVFYDNKLNNNKPIVVLSQKTNILPNVCKYFVYISNKTYPEMGAIGQHSYYYLFNKDTDNNKNEEYLETYKHYIVNDINMFHVDSNKNKFLICDFYPISKHTAHKDVLFISGNVEDLSGLSYDQTYNPETSYDYVVDLNNTTNVVPYMLQGTIPIVGKPVIYIHDTINGYVTNDVGTAIKNSQNIKHVLQKNVKILGYVYSEEVYQTFWKYHLTYTTVPNESILFYLNFAYIYLFRKIPDIVNLGRRSTAANKAVLIDNRANPLSTLSILFSMTNLDETWGCQIYTSSKAKDYYSKQVGYVADVTVLNELDIDYFHIDVYNDIMKNTRFWEGLSCERCLIIQDDGVLLRNGIDNFIDYDYVGAPWADAPDNAYIKQNICQQLVGNGGLSLRNVNIMKKITEREQDDKRLLFYHDLVRVPEDVYFVKYVKNLPTTEVAAGFAVEQVFNIKALGFHKMWSYLHPSAVQAYFNQILMDM